MQSNPTDITSGSQPEKQQTSMQLNQLSTGYAGKNGCHQVAQCINASLYAGEMTCLLGANGVGKSTLLRTLSTFLPPLKGSIKLLNKELSEYSRADLSKVVGVVLTHHNFPENMRTEELVALGRSPYTGFFGNISPNDKHIVEEAMKMVGVWTLKERMVNTLSDGERQKVMIAKVLAQQTPLIFLDEPTAFLDYPSKVEVMQLLLKLAHNEGKTIFLSTHDVELALQLADRLWLMKREYVKTGTPEDLALEDVLSSFFCTNHLLFDETTCRYQIQFPHTTQVMVQGKGSHTTLLTRALKRRHILPVINNQSTNKKAEDCVFTIQVDEHNPLPYTLFSQNGITTQCANIDEVLHHLPSY